MRLCEKEACDARARARAPGCARIFGFPSYPASGPQWACGGRGRGRRWGPAEIRVAVIGAQGSDSDEKRCALGREFSPLGRSRPSADFPSNPRLGGPLRAQPSHPLHIHARCRARSGVCEFSARGGYERLRVHRWYRQRATSAEGYWELSLRAAREDQQALRGDSNARGQDCAPTPSARSGRSSLRVWALFAVRLLLPCPMFDSSFVCL